MPGSKQEIKVGILGATGTFLPPISVLRRVEDKGWANVGVGTVGQRFIQLLATHPYFKIHALGASSRSAGQEYAKVTKWKLSTPIPEEVRKMVVHECKADAGGFKDCGVVFSGLDQDVAGDIGELQLPSLGLGKHQ